MRSKIARGARALIGASAVAVAVLISAAPAATAAVPTTVQHHAQISVAAPRTATLVSQEAVAASTQVQRVGGDGSQVAYAPVSLEEAPASVPGAVFADAFSPCVGIIWLDD